jgi:hypothetical protein
MTNFFNFLYNTYHKALSVSLRKTKYNEAKKRLKRIIKIGNIRSKIESQRLFDKELQEECDKMNIEIGILGYYKPNDISVIQKVGYNDFINASNELLRGLQ